MSRNRNRTLTAVLAFATLLQTAALADSVNSPNITLRVDTNRATGAGAGNVAVTINTITVAETNANEYSDGDGKAIVLRVRPGFQFDPTSSVSIQSATIGFNGAAANAAAIITPAGVADELLTFNLTSGTSGGQDIIRINGIKLRILNAAGAAGPAQTTIQISTSSAGGAFTDQGIVAAAITPGAADRLVFAQQPGANAAGAALLPAVQIVDFGGNLIGNDGRSITLSLQGAVAGAQLLGIAAKDTVSGVATWVEADSLRINLAGAGFGLRAAHSGAPFLTSDTVDSLSFDITAGAAGRLVISKQPVNTVAGGDILLNVTVVDLFGNIVTTPSFAVTLDAAVNPGGWPLLTASSLTKQTENGVAAWSAADHLRINSARLSYRLAASGVGAPVQSDGFDIMPGPANALRYVAQPSDTIQNVVMAPPVSVEIIDAFGNRTVDSSAVTLALANAPCGGKLTGEIVGAVDGLATFDKFEIDTVCTGNTLLATAGNLVAVESSPFNINESDFGEDTPASDEPPRCGACGQGITGALCWLMFAGLGVRRIRKRRAALALVPTEPRS